MIMGYVAPFCGRCFNDDGSRRRVYVGALDENGEYHPPYSWRCTDVTACDKDLEAVTSAQKRGNKNGV